MTIEGGGAASATSTFAATRFLAFDVVAGEDGRIEEGLEAGGVIMLSSGSVSVSAVATSSEPNQSSRSLTRMTAMAASRSTRAKTMRRRCFRSVRVSRAPPSSNLGFPTCIDLTPGFDLFAATVACLASMP